MKHATFDNQRVIVDVNENVRFQDCNQAISAFHRVIDLGRSDVESAGGNDLVGEIGYIILEHSNAAVRDEMT